MGIAQFLKDWWNFFTNYSQISSQISSFENLDSEKKSLAEKVNNLEHTNEWLTKSNKSLLQSNTELRSRQGSIYTEIEQAKDLVTQARKTCIDVHTRRDLLEEDAIAKAATFDAFHEWRHNVEHSLRSKKEVAEAKAELLLANAFRMGIYGFVETSNSAKKVPFIFYDLENKKLMYTPATLKLFGMNADEAEGYTLSKLLFNIDREDLRGREGKPGILSIIKSPRSLEHYEVKTTDGRELQVSTYPISYFDPINKTEKYLGVGILLDDPKVSVKNWYFVKKLGKVFESIKKDTEELLGSVIPGIEGKVSYNI
ncbi:hypothetical protein GOV14_01115 [Candidatus Pacearchaeota archaeon]|nr:hypothetical protein [Candidatus Pacearchaeota archaeon]